MLSPILLRWHKAITFRNRYLPSIEYWKSLNNFDNLIRNDLYYFLQYYYRFSISFLSAPPLLQQAMNSTRFYCTSVIGAILRPFLTISKVRICSRELIKCLFSISLDYINHLNRKINRESRKAIWKLDLIAAIRQNAKLQ